jgi:anhydro-N-acetylmuramic acid kinase
MSGTSADGIDIAITQITGRALAMRPRLLQHDHYPYLASLRQAIFHIRGDNRCTLAELAELARQISHAYAAAVKQAVQKANLSLADLTAVAAHGQTIFHAPPNTIQWLDPALLAYETQCVVVSDFRRADCAAGGQGAPLVPFADYLLFRDMQKARIVLNLGGIANLTYLPPEVNLSDVIAFDTGPANCLSDWLCRQHDPAGPGYDVDGRVASTGSIIPSILDAAGRDAFFETRPPKSTDTPRMIEIFLHAAQSHPNAFFRDLLCTACHLAAAQIAAAIRRLNVPAFAEIIASGGGTQNRCLMSALSHYARLPIHATDEFGIPSAAKEAIAFALIAAATLDGQPANVPSATGARRPVVLGAVTPKP